VAEVLNGHLHREPPPPALPPEVWLALREALGKDPALRPCSAGEVVRRLREGAAQAERRRWRSFEVPRRTRMAALAAALVGAVGFILPWPALPGVESRIGDLRVLTSSARPPDPRILLVIIDEASLQSSPLPLADRADEIGNSLSRIFDAGAQGVAIDFLLPESWSASPGFFDLLLKHSRGLTLAVFSAPGGKVVGTECIDELTGAALGSQQASPVFGFVNLDEDRDGVVRRGRLWFRDRDRHRQPSWATRAARGLRTDVAWEGGTPRSFWIDTRIDGTHYSRISWQQVPAALDRTPWLFRDRLVLVGGEILGSSDIYRRPLPYRSGTGEVVSGLTLQALMVDTIAAGLPVREAGKIPSLVVTILWMACAMAGILCAGRIGPAAVWSAVAAGLYLGASFPVFWWTGLMLPVTAPLLIALLGIVAAFVLRQILPSHPEVSKP
jgi:CHASE2 domain-containing sensor protein